MEQLLPVVIGIVGIVIVLKLLSGVVKMIGIAIVVALVAALYFGMGV
jgi:flagellar motor component MotA